MGPNAMKRRPPELTSGIQFTDQLRLLDSKGTALVEFAITLPVLLALYLGCVQICEVVSVYRKATTTSRTIADLTSQYPEVTDSELDAILDASSQVMAPYSNSKLKMVITHIAIDSAGVAKVTWSRPSGNGATADTVGSTYALPTGVAINDTSLVVAKVNYDYVADIGGFLNTNIPLADTIYMYPRAVTSINKK